MKSFAICGIVGLALSGCAAAKEAWLGDSSPYARIEHAKEKGGNPWIPIDRADVLTGEGSDVWDSRRIVLAGGTPERVCFHYKFRASDVPTEEQIIKINMDAMKQDQLSFRAHKSLDDFGKGKPWPAPTATTADSRVVRTQKVEGDTWIGTHGEVNKTQDSRDVFLEYCAPLPKIEPDTKFLSFVILGKDEDKNLFALWELKGEGGPSGSEAPASTAPAPRSTPTPDSSAPTAATPGTTISNKNLLEVVEAQSDLKTFLSLLKKAGLADLLRGSDAITVVAITDAGWAKLSTKDRKALDEAPASKLKAMLGRFIIKGAVPPPPGTKNVEAQSIEGHSLSFQRPRNRALTIANNPVLRPEVTASNGILYVVEGTR
jgi:uncharacterized surface protein with fasciclin (FAS1) repeats